MNGLSFAFLVDGIRSDKTNESAAKLEHLARLLLAIRHSRRRLPARIIAKLGDDDTIFREGGIEGKAIDVGNNVLQGIGLARRFFRFDLVSFRHGEVHVLRI